MKEFFLFFSLQPVGKHMYLLVSQINPPRTGMPPESFYDLCKQFRDKKIGFNTVLN